jgi:hypothetical protein
LVGITFYFLAALVPVGEIGHEFFVSIAGSLFASFLVVVLLERLRRDRDERSRREP